jgi:hypothetical protein
MTGRLKMCTFWFFVFSRYTLQKLSGLTWSVLVSTVTHVKLLNMISHIFTTKRPLGTYHSALKREFYKESPCINNGKMVYNQKVHIFNRPDIIDRWWHIGVLLIFGQSTYVRLCSCTSTRECGVWLVPSRRVGGSSTYVVWRRHVRWCLRRSRRSLFAVRT